MVILETFAILANNKCNKIALFSLHLFYIFDECLRGQGIQNKISIATLLSKLSTQTMICKNQLISTSNNQLA